ncbi:nitrogen assimilation transcriptional regulator NAC [Streptomyces violarus]|uniref:nitrogen assimilation transcriptional regulator NAC n=1 Tax=Streptomyces violarus TaxID=67380 RepID=UPI0021BF7559|nr:nitrogen assimilation transcriptional regulator NAC [Streptomyces violarus]MCT9137718.1 nitrogen assimilation transcriptional regulator NAC [Streptomyces violarus]
MDTRRLYSFIKIIDAGSITRAADILHIAQPALSQQLSALEAQFGQQLLIRSKRGVAPTEAGRALYRHAQLILRQVDLAHAAVEVSGRAPAGSVSVGLAPYSLGAALALPLLKSVRERYPDVLLHINENFGGVISEAIMTGRMDMAFIYGAGPLRGVQFEPLRTEDLFLIGAPGGTAPHGAGEVDLDELKDVPLLLPSRIHTIRQVVDAAFQQASLLPNVVGEVESALTLVNAVDAGLGATVLPWSAARAILDVRSLSVRRIVHPVIQVKLSLVTSDNQPLSEPALAVHDLFLELITEFDGSPHDDAPHEE